MLLMRLLCNKQLNLKTIVCYIYVFFPSFIAHIQMIHMNVKQHKLQFCALSPFHICWLMVSVYISSHKSQKKNQQNPLI